MTAVDITALVDLLVQQVGLKPDQTLKSTEFWKLNLLQADKTAVLEGFKVIMLNDSVKSKDPGKWIGAILKYCGDGVQRRRAHESEPLKINGCDTCRHSGCVEVPHHKDWTVDEYNFQRWNGQYTMVVACDCQMGQQRACQMMTIRGYENNFPLWKEEYPVKMFAFQQRQAEKRLPLMQNEKDKKLTRDKIATLQALQGEV